MELMQNIEVAMELNPNYNDNLSDYDQITYECLQVFLIKLLINVVVKYK